MIEKPTKLNVVITYNKLFRNLTYVSASLLKTENIVVHLNYVEQNTKNSRGFRSDVWYECLEKKIIFADQIFRSIENNQVLCVADSDIYYLNSDKIYSLQKYMNDHDIDFMSGSEHDHNNYDKNKSKANCGFFLVRKTPSNSFFFRNILKYDFSLFPYAEQDIINLHILSNLKYEILNPLDFAMGCYMYTSIKANPNKITMLHCTCAESLQKKIIQIDNLINYYSLEPIKWFRTQINKKEKKFYISGEKIYDYLEDN